MTLLESKEKWMRGFANAGFGLTPLMPGTKKPYTLGFPNTEPDPNFDMASYPDNYGVVLNKNTVVIDVDPRAFKEDDNAFVRLFKDIGLPLDLKTFIVRSREGVGRAQDGLHIYLKKPAGVKLRTRVAKYKGVEIKTYGSQLCGPGSIHPDTKKPYVVLRGDVSNIPEAPEALIRMYEDTRVAGGASELDPLDDDASIRRFKKYIESGAPIAVQGHGGDEITLKVAMIGRDYRLSESATFKVMLDYYNQKCEPPWHPEELAIKVANAYKYAKDSIGNMHPAADFEGVEIPDVEDDRPQITKDRDSAMTKAKITWDEDWVWKNSVVGRELIRNRHSTIRNVKNYFRVPDHGIWESPLYKLIQFNEFTHEIEFTRDAEWHLGRKSKAWKDADLVAIRAWFSERMNWNPKEKDILDGVVSYAHSNAYHPIKKYLLGLEWDGERRLDRMMNLCLGVKDDEYTRAVSKNLLLGMVARVFEPGCQYDHVVVIEGAQGIGKSSFCRILGGEYHSDVFLDPHNKDTVVVLIGTWLAELSEMLHSKKAEVEAVKRIISSPVDRIRLPYGRVASKILRQSVFVGTTNSDKYLSDETGNRRWWPVVANGINLEWLRENRDQLFAEALLRYELGESYHFTDISVIDMAAVEQRARMREETWASVIETWLGRLEEQPRTLTTAFIATEVLNLKVANINGITSHRILSAMQQIGWGSGRINTPIGQRRGYINPLYEEE